MTLKNLVDLREAGQYVRCLKAIAVLEKSSPALSLKMARKLGFLRAEVLLDMERYRDAIVCYKALSAEEISDVASANEGLAHWELGEFAEALTCYRLAIKLNPANALALRGAVEMHLKLDAPSSAIPLLTKAIGLKPRYQEAYTALGIANFQLGRWSKAHASLSKALELDPDDEQAKKGLRLIEKELG